MNPVMFNIGRVEFRWYSFFVLIAVLVGFVLALREGKRRNIDKDIIFDMGFYTVIFGILGARLYYVLFNLDVYQHDFLEIFRLWNGGLAIHGGILIGLLTIYLFSKLRKVNMLELTDIVAPSLVLGQAIGRWGNFFNSEAHGPVTTLTNLQSLKIIPDFVIKGMKIDGVYYHPTFYYEFLWCLLGFIIILLVRKFYKNRKSGQITCLYLMIYSLGRFFIESLRTDSLMIKNFKAAQVISVILFVVSFIFFIILLFKKEEKVKIKTNKKLEKKENKNDEKLDNEVKEDKKVKTTSTKAVTKKTTKKTSTKTSSKKTSSTKKTKKAKSE